MSGTFAFIPGFSLILVPLVTFMLFLSVAFLISSGYVSTSPVTGSLMHFDSGQFCFGPTISSPVTQICIPVCVLYLSILVFSLNVIRLFF